MNDLVRIEAGSFWQEFLLAASPHVGDDGARRGDEVFGFNDGSADDDVIDTGAHRILRRHDALLIIVVSA